MNIVSSARPMDLSLWKKMWIKAAVKADKRDLKETRCHSETIEVPLEENMYLRSLIWLENASSLLVLYAHITGRKNQDHLSQKSLSYLPSSHTRFSYWIPQLAIRRNMLSWLTDSL